MAELVKAIDCKSMELFNIGSNPIFFNNEICRSGNEVALGAKNMCSIHIISNKFFQYRI